MSRKTITRSPHGIPRRGASEPQPSTDVPTTVSAAPLAGEIIDAQRKHAFPAHLDDLDPYAADPVRAILVSVQHAAALDTYYRDLLAKTIEESGDASAHVTVNDKGDARIHPIAELAGQWADRALHYAETAVRLGIEKKRVEDQQAVGAQFAKVIMKLMYHPRLGLSGEQRTTLHALALEALEEMGTA